jgi:hypothetical protein
MKEEEKKNEVMEAGEMTERRSGERTPRRRQPEEKDDHGHDDHDGDEAIAIATMTTIMMMGRR